MILEFRNFLGPTLTESFDQLIDEMIHDGAQNPIEEIDRKIDSLRKEINAINSKRRILSESKALFETIYEKLDKFLNHNEDDSMDLVMLRIVLKSRIEGLEVEIKHTKPNDLLKSKGLLKARKEFLSDNRELGFHLLESIYKHG